MDSICHLTVGLGMGGIERLLVDLVGRSDPTRFTHSVCCLVAGGPRQHELERLGVPVYHIRGTSASDARTLFRLTRLLRRVRPAILHVHCPLYSSWAVPAALLAGIRRVVCTVHSTYWHRGPKLCLVQALGVLQRRWVSRTIAISGAVADYVRREKCATAEQTVVIHNGIDLSRFDPDVVRPRLRRELALDDSAEVIGAVGGLRPEKGHAYLLEAFRAVSSQYPKAHLVLIGDGALRARLEASAREARLAHRVHFLGPRDHVELDLPDLDLFVLPSVTEGFGLAVVEAMALGVPVVASDLPGIGEVVGSEGAALLIPPADPGAIADALLSLLADRRRREDLGRKGRQRARAFDVETMVKRIDTVYGELLSRGSEAS